MRSTSWKLYKPVPTQDAPKIGFIAQEMEAAVQGKPNFESLVGNTQGDDEEPSTKTLDYSRLTAILWTCVKDLHSKVQELQSAVG